MTPRRPTNFVDGTGQRATWAAIRDHVLSSSSYTCQQCGTGDVNMEVDHIWPRHFGGDDHASNLQALCRSCNRAKGNKVNWSEATDDQLEAAILASGKRADEALAEWVLPMFVLAERGTVEMVDAMADALIESIEVLRKGAHDHVPPGAEVDRAAGQIFAGIFAAVAQGGPA